MTIARTVEFQLDAGTLLRQVSSECQTRLRMTILGTEWDPNRPDDSKFLIDRVDIQAGGEVRRGASNITVELGSGTLVTVNPLEIRVPFAARLKATADLLKPPCRPEQTSGVVNGVMVLEAVVDRSAVNVRLARVDLPAGVVLPSGVLAAAMASVGALSVPLPLQAIVNMLAVALSVRTAGIVAGREEGAADFVAIRMEFDQFATDGTTADDEWRDFFAGRVPDRRSGAGWSLLLGRTLFEESQRLKILASVEASDKISLSDDRAFSATYSPNGARGGGHVRIEFSGKVKKFCPNVLHVDPVAVDLDYFVDSQGTGAVSSDAVASWTINPLDVLLCLLPSAVLGAQVASVIVGVGEALAMTIDPKGFRIPGTCTFDTDDSSKFHCLTPVKLSPLVIGATTTRFSLHGMRGDEDGPVLFGSLSETTPTVGDALTVTVGNVSFGIEGEKGSCTRTLGYGGFLELYGNPAVVFAVTVFDDPLRLFSVTPNKGDLDLDVKIDFGRFGPDIDRRRDLYFAAPYAPAVFVRTGAGVCSLPLNVVTKPDPSSIFPLQLEAARQAIDCKTRHMLATGWHGIPGEFDPNWLVDPPWLINVLVENRDGIVVTVPGRIATTSPRFTFTAPVPTGDVAAPRFTLTSVPFRWQGTVWLSCQDLPDIDFPMDEIVRGDFDGEHLGASGASLTLAKVLPMSLTVPRFALPDGVRSIVVEHRLHPGHLRLETTIVDTPPVATDVGNGVSKAMHCGCR